MWKPLLMSAISAFILPLSSTNTLPFSRRTSSALAALNITSPAQQAAPKRPANPTYERWPVTPYSLRLHGHDLLFPEVYLKVALVHPFPPTSPPIDTAEIQHFLGDFTDNLGREHPVPGFAPRYASQSTIDMASYTKWTIELSEGPMRRMPTAVALAAIDALGREVARCEPARVAWLIREVGTRLPWAWGLLWLDDLEGTFLNESGTFQTA